MLTDLLMPKLGLTMIEGTVAKWAVAPGACFNADDVVAVIETDKIAYDIAAPGSGILAKILVPSGTTVTVGTPIARWELKDAAIPEAPAATIIVGPSPATGRATASSRLPPLAEPAVAPITGKRIVATPYARRLARNAGIELASIIAANGRRIRAADVETALARRAAVAAPRAAVPQPEYLFTAGFNFMSTEVSADRLLRVIADIAEGAADLRPAPVHFVILAAARALADQGLAPVIAFQRDNLPPHIFDPDACRSLSSIVAVDRAGSVAAAAAVTLLVADHTDATLVARMPPLGCGATLGVGVIARVFRPDDAGAPVLRAEFQLGFSQREDAALPGGSTLLQRIRSFLENPLVLLVI